MGPLINKQYDNFTNILKLYNHRNHTVKYNKTNSQTHPKPIDLSPRHQNLTLPNISFPNNHLSSDLAPPPNQISHSHPSSPTILVSPNLDLAPPPNPTLSHPSLPVIPLPPNLNLSPLPNLFTPSQPPSLYYSPTPPNLDPTSPPNLISTSQFSFATTSRTPNLKLPGHQSGFCDKNENTQNVSLPDMGTILKNFGIEPSNLKLVPLKEYNWNKMSINDIPVTPHSPTISQRIKSMRRAARHKVILTNVSGMGLE